MWSARPLPCLAALLLAAAATPVAAQEEDVTRGSFPFFQRTLSIAVNTRVPGELQILRSRAARVDVAALAAPGVATFAIGGYTGDELRLTAAGAEHAVFIVTVPERVYVSVKAPGTSRSFGAFTPVETVEWGSGERPERAPDAPPILSGGSYYHIYGAGEPPRTLRFASLASVRRLDVRIEGHAFSVASSRALSVQPGAPDPLIVDIGGEPVDLLVRLPAGTREFRIESGDRVVLGVRNGQVEQHCTPALLQTLRDGSVRVMLSPRNGRLECVSR